MKSVRTKPLADPRGRSRLAPPSKSSDSFILTCIEIFQNVGALGVGTPLLRGWRPLLREILDPPLQAVSSVTLVLPNMEPLDRANQVVQRLPSIVSKMYQIKQEWTRLFFQIDFLGIRNHSEEDGLQNGSSFQKVKVFDTHVIQESSHGRNFAQAKPGYISQ